MKNIAVGFDIVSKETLMMRIYVKEILIIVSKQGIIEQPAEATNK
jgi:hypothetical protein